MASDLKPRLCCMTKAENGYGFHLHGEKGKSGQYIRKVEPGSPAEASGLRAGDRVVEVNGENVERETHHQVVQRIKAVEDETRLLVVDRQTDECLRSLRLTCTEDMATNVSPSPAPPPGKRENGSVSSPPAALTGEVPKPRRRSPSHAGKKDVQVPGKSSSADSSHLVPRLCHLVRADTGYGFNLHSEKSRPGQYIRSLDPDSPANRAGLRPQDRLIEVNGVNIECMRHAEVVAFIKRSGDETHLLVVDPDTDEHFKRLGIIPSSNQAKAERRHVQKCPEASSTNSSMTGFSHTDCQAQSITNGTQSPHFNGRTTSQSTHSDHSSQDTSTQNSEDGSNRLLDPFAEIGLKLSPTAAEAKEKAHAKRARKRAPHMDWNKKYELFSNF
ncbi:Na(+)/H(+) exchange regulatory cofactor NHE-RF2 isoform X2 [Electrophorus electricus]|uniref:Na(+)/H(+) exchange regulatory cofactor NHE-RF2 isoform X2 n=1 Tax=Electrophorus electricus TaxID=8005 RepID=UPI0015D0836A|nr:Na(+)/H(+) exchange regulatory cofactor NHE-RF2 isoform X2 [Electrophorus electricus]